METKDENVQGIIVVKKNPTLLIVLSCFDKVFHFQRKRNFSVKNRQNHDPFPVFLKYMMRCVYFNGRSCDHFFTSFVNR